VIDKYRKEIIYLFDENSSDDIPFLELGLEGIDPISLEVFKSFFRVARFQSQLVFKLTSEKGIYPGQAMCLWFISQQPGISQRDLAQKMHVAPPTITHMIQKLEKTGYVIRKPDKRDQRLSRIYLTDAGNEMLQVLKNIFANIINISLQDLNQEEQKELVRLFDTMSSNIIKEL